MIQFSIEGNTADELLASFQQLCTFLGRTNVVEIPAEIERAPAEPQEDQSPENAGQQEEATAPDAPSAPVSKDALRAKLIELMNVRGESAPSALLKKHFEVSKISDLMAEHYHECFTLAQAAIDAAE